MKISVLGSNSSGNCYLLEHNNEILVIDAGIPFKDIKIGLNFNLMGVKGVIISHSHL